MLANYKIKKKYITPPKIEPSTDRLQTEALHHYAITNSLEIQFLIEYIKYKLEYLNTKRPTSNILRK